MLRLRGVCTMNCRPSVEARVARQPTEVVLFVVCARFSMNVAIASLRRRKPSPVSRPQTDDELSMNFRVDLESFRGPLDLLLYLVRKHELDIVDLPIAMVTVFVAVVIGAPV